MLLHTRSQSIRNALVRYLLATMRQLAAELRSTRPFYLCCARVPQAPASRASALKHVASPCVRKHHHPCRVQGVVEFVGRHVQDGVSNTGEYVLRDTPCIALRVAVCPARPQPFRTAQEPAPLKHTQGITVRLQAQAAHWHAKQCRYRCICHENRQQCFTVPYGATGYRRRRSHVRAQTPRATQLRACVSVPPTTPAPAARVLYCIFYIERTNPPTRSIKQPGHSRVQLLVQVFACR